MQPVDVCACRGRPLPRSRRSAAEGGPLNVSGAALDRPETARSRPTDEGEDFICDWPSGWSLDWLLERVAAGAPSTARHGQWAAAVVATRMSESRSPFSSSRAVTPACRRCLDGHPSSP